jgi:iron complex outermembrane receptor protein
MKQVKTILLFGMLLLAGVAVAQNTVTGKVTGYEDKHGLPGVSVVVKNSTPIIGTSTDINGNYSISVPDNATLVFSYTGMAQQEYSVAGKSTIDVVMGSATQSLNTVVVVGYGTASKEKLTGSVASVSEGDFKQGVVTNASALIAGKVAGVNITPSSGRAGDGNRIRIRGGASLNASNDPLIVIDGLPLSNDGIGGQTNPLASLNPNDIENMTILKDASATAIYGSRASNGVIIITTKRGENATKKLNIDFSTINSIATVARKVDVLSGEEFRTLLQEYDGYAGSTPAERLKEKSKWLGYLGDANTDWQKEIYRPAFSSDNNITLSGKVPHLPYRVSVGYTKQDGLLKTDNMQRVTTAISLSPSLLKDHLRFDVNLRGSYARSRFGDGGAIGAAIRFDPTQPVTADGMDKYNGYWQWENQPGVWNSMATQNPVAILNSRLDIGHVYRGFGNISADYKFHFLPELRANVNLGFDVANGRGTNSILPWRAGMANRGGEKSEYNSLRTDLLLEAYLAYDKDFGKNHFDIMAGYTYQSWKTKNNNFPTYRYDTTKGTEPLTTPDFPYDIPEHILISFFGRANYGYAGKYLIQASVRTDGSSRFSSTHRWGWFPAASAAWVISKENFLADNPKVDILKLRFGWGMTGQQEIGNYDYLARYGQSANTAMYQFGNEWYYMWKPRGYDSDRHWEATTTYNAGFDYGFLNGKVYGSIDAYYKVTTDLLNEIDVPMGSNFTNRIVRNIGSMTNKGIELSINYLPVANENLTVDLGFNVTVNKSKITQLTLNDADTNYQGVNVGGISGGTGNNVQIHSVGYNPYSFFLYKQLYDDNGKPIVGTPEAMYADLNGDGIINEKDRYRYKSPEPLLFLGLNVSINWKNWNFATMFRANIGNYVYNNIYSDAANYQTVLNNNNFLQNTTPDIYNTGFVVPQYLSDYYVQNASFLKMDYVSVGYTFNNLGGKQGMRLALNLTVQNVFTLTGYKGVDPEIAVGIDNNIYTYPRTFSLGIKFSY